MDWYPAPGESSLIRSPASFATGYAAPVLGRHSFRDTDRNDIQHELTGWPQGAPFELRSKKDQTAGGVFEGIFRAIPLVIGAIVELGGGAGGPGGSTEPKGRSQEPADEVEDFPVIWAASGTTARTLPWQLDKARLPRSPSAPDRLRTDLVVTDQRLLILGSGPDLMAPADVLWQVPRDLIATADHRRFSVGKADVKITFTDGSWTRLHVGSSGDAGKVVQHLNSAVRLLAAVELTDGQRDRVA